jgi:flagellar protein FliO/FliZ
VANASYLEAIGGLFLVVLLILAMGWALKRLNLNPAHRGSLRVLGGVSLGGRERALLLEAEGQRLLLGVSQGQVNLLMRLDGPDGMGVSKTSAEPGFPEQLRQQLQQPQRYSATQASQASGVQAQGGQGD